MKETAMRLSTIRSVLGLSLLAMGTLLLFLSCGQKTQDVEVEETDGKPRYWLEATAPQVEETPALIQRGEEIYQETCSLCHGTDGKGEGTIAEFMVTPPTDFTAGRFKIRTTPTGFLPTDMDLFRSITIGFPEYGMPGFYFMPPEDRWGLVYYLKQFDPAFSDPERVQPIRFKEAPDKSNKLVTLGERLFTDAGCVKCHGTEGRGDGPLVAELKDYRGNDATPRDLTQRTRELKGGARAQDIHRTLMTGLNGTPMASFKAAFEGVFGDVENGLWALAYHVENLAREGAAENRAEWERVRQSLAAEEAQGEPEPVDESLSTQLDEVSPEVAKEKSCLACHEGIENVNPTMEEYVVALGAGHKGRACVICHEGDPDAHTKTAAHEGMFGNPGKRLVVQKGKGCGLCHSNRNSFINMQTLALGQAGRYHLKDSYGQSGHFGALAAIPTSSGRYDVEPRIAFPPDLDLIWEIRGQNLIFSSPRTAHLNGDDVLDIVLGHVRLLYSGDTPVAGFVSAYDGVDGTEIWRLETQNDMFASACFVPLDDDGVPDVVIGGRLAQLYAISGKTGEQIWKFLPDGAEAREQGWLDYYSVRPLYDVNDDGVVDLLAANGGDTSAPAFEPRPPGHMMVIDGATGETLSAALTPDRAETYVSPYLLESPETGELQVLYGTGGETLPGSLWIVAVDDLLDGDISGSREIVAPASYKGIVAPPALADLNGDQVFDIVVCTFDGRTVAVDGATYRELWSYTLEDAETCSTPAIGYFNDDATPDVLASFSLGVWPEWNGSTHMILDGTTGEALFTETYTDLAYPSPLAVDLDGDGLDEGLYFAIDLYENEERFFIVRGGDFEVMEMPAFKGVGASTAWVGDLESDGMLEIIHAYSPDWGFDFTSAEDFNWRIQCRSLNAPVPEQISWGAYLGTRYDGRFTATRP